MWADAVDDGRNWRGKKGKCLEEMEKVVFKCLVGTITIDTIDTINRIELVSEDKPKADVVRRVC